MTNEEGPGLPEGLDEADLDEIRSLAVEALAETGMRTVQIEPNTLVLEDGERFFLHSTAHACANVDRSEWPQVVAHYTRAMAAPSVLESAELPDEEFLRLVRARIIGPDALEGLGQSYHYAGPLVPDRPETSPLLVLCHDLPDSVITLADLHLKDRDLDAVWAAALANTAAEPVDEHDVIENEGARIEIFRGNSFFTAAKTLNVDALLDGRKANHGAVFAIPFQQIILLHLPRDTGETAISLNLMAHLSRSWHEQASKPISPEVFYVRDGVYQQLTERGAEGDIAVQVEGRFFDTLNELADGPTATDVSGATAQE